MSMSTRRRRISDDEVAVVQIKTPSTAKRRRTAGPNDAERTLQQLRACFDALEQLKAIKKEDGKQLVEPFLKNPSKRIEPEYYKIVKNPMDFVRLQAKLRADEYESLDDFYSDFELMIDNNLKYYKPADPQYKDAIELKNKFDEKKVNIESGRDEATSTPKANGVMKVKQEPISPPLTRSKSPSVASASEALDERVVEDILASVLELADEDGRLLSPPFRLLQSPEEFPEYYEKIKSPIDLKTIAEKTRAGCYTSLSALEADFRLLVKNAKSFNEPNSLIHKDAATILKVFLKKKGDAHGKNIPSDRAEKCRQIVDSLIAQLSADDGDVYSEDSEEDEELESSSELGWQLYWAVRNVLDNDGTLTSEYFEKLPSKSEYADYYDEVESPMSLFMVNRRLKRGMYSTLDELVDDFVLIFDNAQSYNLEGSEIYEAAKILKSTALRKVKALKPDIDISKWMSSRDSSPDPAKADASTTLKCFKKSLGRIKEEPLDDMEGTSDSQSDTATPPPHKIRKRHRKMRPISTGITPLPDSKPGRKSMDELMLRFRMKLMNFWTMVAEYKEGEYWPSLAFMDKPNPIEWPDYYKVISHPICMNDIKERIENNGYNSSTELLGDFHQMFTNAKTFNRVGSELYMDATKLENMLLNAHEGTKDAPYESPLVLKEKMGWLKTKLPMYSSKSKAAAVANGLSSAPRPSSEDDADSLSNQSIRMADLPQEQKNMFHLLMHLRDYTDGQGRKLATDFLRLPSRLELPSYYEVIKKPLDFARIQQKLSSKFYRSPPELMAEIQLMFENACKFNEPESQIYKDAITLQGVLLQKKRDLFCALPSTQVLRDKPPHLEQPKKLIPYVAMEMRGIFTSIFVAVFSRRKDGHCHSDSLAEVPDLLKAKGIPEADWPYSFDQIKKNIDRGRYKRLDRFQADCFNLFYMARQVARSDSQLFEDAVQLLYEFVRVRDEQCKNLIVSEAFMQRHKDLETAIGEERLKKVAEEAELERKEERESDEKQNGLNDDSDLQTVTVAGVEFAVGEYALVSPSEDAKKGESHLMRIEKVTEDEDSKESLVCGRWFYRPHETYHLATKKFADNEVFLTNFRDTVTADRLLSKACILQPRQWTKYAPKGFAPAQVFICEERYLGKQLHFKKIKNWPFPEDDDAFELEERDEPLPLARTKRELVLPVNGHGDDDEKSQDSSTTQESAASEGDRCADIYLLDVERPEVKVGEEADGVTYYEQLVHREGIVYALGQFVFVYNKNDNLDIMRIDRLWKDGEGVAHFSGGTFIRPTDLPHDPNSAKFYKKEVLAVVQADKQRKVDDILAKCAVLPLKQYTKERPTEIPECDVYVCENKIIGDVTWDSEGPTTVECSLFAGLSIADKNLPINSLASAKSFNKFKSYTLREAVPHDEVFLFKTPMNMDKESPMVVAKVEEVDQDVDDTMSDADITESIGAKELVSWLSHQPKLNSKSKSGYILFSAEIRKRIMHENPEAGFGEVSKIVGVEWKKLSEDQKKQYEIRAEYIADQRAKQEAASIATAKQIQPGQIKVWSCKWQSCDFQFDCPEGLNEHVVHFHTSQILEGGENQYVCMWQTCMRNRKEGKAFPSLPRLHRHIKEKHVSSTAFKVISNNLRSRNFYKYQMTPGENGAPNTAQLILMPPPPTNGHSFHNGGLVPSSLHGQMNGNHPGSAPSPPTPRINGIMDSRFPSTPSGPSQPPQGLHPQQFHHSTPASSSAMAHGGHQQPSQSHLPQPMTSQPAADARTFITMSRPEPVFVAPPSSVHARRVLHSESYVKYIDSMYNSRQRSVSQYERNLRATQRTTATQPNRPLPLNWIVDWRQGRGVREEDVVRALWRLREELVESTVAVARDPAAPL